jgi:hypothetical protein
MLLLLANQVLHFVTIRVGKICTPPLFTVEIGVAVGHLVEYYTVAGLVLDRGRVNHVDKPIDV